MPDSALTLAYKDSTAIARRLEALETKPQLDVDVVAEMVPRISEPHLLGKRLGPAIRYSQRVEAEVADLSIETLLPRADHTHLKRFLHVWTPDELGHADAQDVLLRQLDLPTYTSRPEDAVPIHNRVAGSLGRLSHKAHDMVAMIYHTIGAINEKLAMTAYDRMAVITRDLGETELADTLFDRMRRDEAQHLGYYRTTARRIRRYLPAWQMTMVRAFIVHTYAPVGAGDQKDKAPLGEAIEALEEDPENPSVATRTQAIAEELLARPGRQLPPFVFRTLQQCVHLARQERRTLTA